MLEKLFTYIFLLAHPLVGGAERKLFTGDVLQTGIPKDIAHVEHGVSTACVFTPFSLWLHATLCDGDVNSSSSSFLEILHRNE